ncbi:dUTP diphosphatase [Paenibacillus hexagrammi]|uniref:dUTP diphosphatase n=1 Tax=Paenibacillus hexagrammi TaxID=2908839 RepID=A0ABY3SRM7_9BACL|nr:dUTP diphosphatase [Paenibacillus sp. YPD9-1]UJF36581.1 dUTP diphosphatase [Paenibacillus sp. YPD9-1]
MQIKIKKLSADAVIPKYATELSAGFDLVASEDIVIPPSQTAMVPTGLAIELPAGYELQVRPRSGVSYKTKLRVANAPGTVDADYRGEIKVLVDNIHVPSAIGTSGVIAINGELIRSDGTYPVGTCIIHKGDRIAQGVITKVEHVELIETEDELTETDRGQGGFGHTGVQS